MQITSPTSEINLYGQNNMNEREMKSILKELEELLIKKNKTYGDNNIVKMGKLGVLTRIEEKIERIKHMINNNVRDDESIEDSWQDIAGFGIIGLMLERNKWNK